MEPEELQSLAKQIAAELGQSLAPALAAGRLPTFDVSAASNCCEGHCPCDSRNGGTCPCNTRCACDGKVARRDDLDLVSRLSTLPEAGIKSVLEAAPLLQKLRLEALPVKSG